MPRCERDGENGGALRGQSASPAVVHGLWALAEVRYEFAVTKSGQFASEYSFVDASEAAVGTSSAAASVSVVSRQTSAAVAGSQPAGRNPVRVSTTFVPVAS
jgi:hypothetical protein